MREQLQIVFRGMDQPVGIDESTRGDVAHLEAFFNRITACKVLVEHESAAIHANEDIHVAIRGAFDAAKRGLRDDAWEIRGDIKTHTAPLP